MGRSTEGGNLASAKSQMNNGGGAQSSDSSLGVKCLGGGFPNFGQPLED